MMCPVVSVFSEALEVQVVDNQKNRKDQNRDLESPQSAETTQKSSDIDSAGFLAANSRTFLLFIWSQHYSDVHGSNFCFKLDLCCP